MSPRRTRSVRVSDETWTTFVEQVVEWEGQKHGELGRHVENALEEYIDHGTNARIEEKVDEILTHVSDDSTAHTHIHSTGASNAVEKAREIHKRITRNHDSPIKQVDIERAIEDIAGADPRTLDKYCEILKKRALLFRHPTSAVWTEDRGEWAEWCESYVNNDPEADISDIISAYSMSIEDYEHALATAETATNSQ